MRHFRRHADAFAQRRMRVNGFANIDCVRAHFNGQRNLADHVARVGADHAAAKNLAVAVCLRGSSASVGWVPDDAVFIWLCSRYVGISRVPSPDSTKCSALRPH